MLQVIIGIMTCKQITKYNFFKPINLGTYVMFHFNFKMQDSEDLKAKLDTIIICSGRSLTPWTNHDNSNQSSNIWV